MTTADAASLPVGYDAGFLGVAAAAAGRRSAGARPSTSRTRTSP